VPPVRTGSRPPNQKGDHKRDRKASGAVPLRSVVPRTPTKCREYRPREAQRFRGFSPVFATIRGLAVYRGEGLIPAFLCGFRRLCGLFAVPSHEARPAHLLAASWPSGKRSRRRRLRQHKRAPSSARRSAARPPKASANRRRQARRAAVRALRLCSAGICSAPRVVLVPGLRDCATRVVVGQADRTRVVRNTGRWARG
jgi:hypothetical protein